MSIESEESAGKAASAIEPRRAGLLHEKSREALERAEVLLDALRGGIAARRVTSLTDANAVLADENDGLRTAMDTRAVIEQAKGVIIGATGCDADEAFQILVSQSQNENRKLHTVAAELVASKITRRG